MADDGDGYATFAKTIGESKWQKGRFECTLCKGNPNPNPNGTLTLTLTQGSALPVVELPSPFPKE